MADLICSRLAFLLQSGIQPPLSLPQGLYIYWCFYSVFHLWGVEAGSYICATWYHHLGCGHFNQNRHLTRTKLTQPDSSLRIRTREFRAGSGHQWQDDRQRDQAQTLATRVFGVCSSLLFPSPEGSWGSGDSMSFSSILPVFFLRWFKLILITCWQKSIV